jgi:predicted nucleotidyltransferase
MRLSSEEIQVLKDTLAVLSPEAKLYLFGSRTDDTKQGGDIDLLVVSECLSRKDLSRLRIEFFERFGEQKMDILLDDGNFTPIFHRLVRQKAQPL